MLPLRYTRRWRAAGATLLILVLAAMLMPTVWVSKGTYLAWFLYVDKWLHGIIFVFLAVWFAGQYRPASYWRIAIGLIAFGVLTEFCQRLVTYRSADWFDLVADAAGIGVGLIVALAGLGGWSLRVEQWLKARQVSEAIE
jgi:hypothetical protein